MSLKMRVAGVLVTLIGTLSSAAVTANAQVALGSRPQAAQPALQREVATVSLAAKACSPNFWYIAGNGVRIRKQPNGAIAGFANYWETVEIFWRSGVWVYVHLKERPLYIHPRSGYVHQDYVKFHQPTCW